MTIFRNRFIVTIFSFVFLLLVGCIPIPWSKDYLKHPELTICVYDSLGNSRNATIQFTRSLIPHGADSVFSYTTDDRGCIYITRKIESETIMPLMMHGVHEYAFSILIKTEIDSTSIYCWQWTRDVSEEESINSYFNYRYDSLKVHMVDSNLMQVVLN